MIINHNIAALNTHRQMGQAQNAQMNSMEKLSSGLRINSAKDDAAGLTISEKMRGQIRGLEQGSRNAQDGISMAQTAEGTLSVTQDILQRMQELAVQSANDTNTSDDRTKIQSEVDELAKEITRISNTTEFNTRNLLSGGMNSTLQIGANSGQNISLSLSAMDAASLGIASSQNQADAFGAGATTLGAGSIGTEDLGKGLSSQTYNIDVTHTVATASETADTTAGAAITGTYSGDRDEKAMFRVTAVTGARVSGAELSLDGGKTWNAQTVTDSGSDSSLTYKGTTVTFTDGAANTVGKSASYTLNAQKDSIQLSDASGNIGSAVTVYKDQTSVKIGDSSTGRTMTINSTSLGELTTGTATQDVSSVSSTAATFNADGSLINEARTISGVDVSSQESANTAIKSINDAIDTVSTARSKLGAFQNRLEHTINNLNTSAENLTSAESRIRDVDYAEAA